MSDIHSPSQPLSSKNTNSNVIVSRQQTPSVESHATHHDQKVPQGDSVSPSVFTQRPFGQSAGPELHDRVPKKRRRLTKQQRQGHMDQIAEFAQQGEPLEAIRIRLGISKSQLNNYCMRLLAEERLEPASLHTAKVCRLAEVGNIVKKHFGLDEADSLLLINLSSGEISFSLYKQL